MNEDSIEVKDLSWKECSDEDKKELQGGIE